MTKPHVIRLQGPWQFEFEHDGSQEAVQEPGVARSRGGRIKLPITWQAAFGDAVDCAVRLTRAFGRPTGLDRDERVWLLVETPHRCSVQLNGSELGCVERRAASLTVDVTLLLEPRNQLGLCLGPLHSSSPPVDRDHDPSGDADLEQTMVNVRLEIRRAESDGNASSAGGT